MAKATVDSVVASRKLSLVFVALLSLGISVQAEANFTLWVIRRSTADLYSLASIEHMNCEPKSNYLVNEKQCALDEELFYGCSIAIVPIYSTFLVPTTAIDNTYSAITSIVTLSDECVVIFAFNGTNQTVNSSFCNISSLEVYRGRQKAIEISHQGFSLSDNGSIEIHKDQLAYDTEEYVGELYRMNLSCSGRGLPESGCLFFKVAGNTSTVAGKFNSTVPGTFRPDNDTQESTDPTEEDITVTTVDSESTIIITAIESTTKDSIFAIGGILFYTVIGVGGGIIVLTFSFIILCLLIRYSVQKKRKSHIFTTAATLQTHNGIQTPDSEPSPYESPRPNSAERVDDPTLMANNGHLYQPTVANTDNDYRTGQDRYQVHFFPTEIEHNIGLIAEGNNNNAPIQSPESKIKHSPTNSKEDLDLSQVYDAVSPKPSEDRAAAGMVYDRLTHSNDHGKQSLPTYLGGAPEYSALSIWKDSPHTKDLGESMPVYDAPDVKIKGQISELAMMMPSSHKISSCSCPPLPLFTVESRDTDLEHTYAILEQERLQQSIHIQATNIIESEHTCAILEQIQLQQSSACVQTTNDHTYAILEHDQVEELSPSEDNTREVYMEHMYAILEQDQHLSHSSHEQTEPECHILEEEGQPNSWMSASLQSQKSKPERKHSRSRDANFELVQIYNTVSPTPPKTRAAEAAEHHSHQACSKKQSLPSYLGARPMEYSAMDVRNAPDVKKKKRKKKKESEVPSNSEAAIAATSHKISTTSCPPLSLFTDTNTSRCSTMDAPVTDSYQQKKVHTANQEHA